MTHIEELKLNLERMEHTLSLGGWNEGYVKNLKQSMMAYRTRIAELENAVYPIGTKFETQGKRKDICTVVDGLYTYNNANELVEIRYVATHEFMGQTVKNRDVCKTTIARGIIV